MVKNKKKLRRQERLTSQTLKSLGLSVVLAGGIVMAGVGMAGAAAITDTNGVYTATTAADNIAADPLTISSVTSISSGTVASAATVTLTGDTTISGAGTLTLIKGTSVLTVATSASKNFIVNAATAGSALTPTLSIVNGTTLNTSVGNAFTLTQGYVNIGEGGTLKVKETDLQGGSINLTGSSGKLATMEWIIAGTIAKTTGNGSTINVGSYGVLDVKAITTPSLAAGIINLSGETALASALINSTGKALGIATAVNVMEGKFGTIYSDTSLGIGTNGSVNVAGTLNVLLANGNAGITTTINGDASVSVEKDGVLNAFGTGATGIFEVGNSTTGTLNTTNLTLNSAAATIAGLNPKGVYANKMVVDVTGSEVTVSGNASLTGAAALTVSAGSAEVTGNTTTSNAAGVLAVSGTGAVDLSNGTLTLTGGTAGAVAVSGGTLKIDGDKFTVTTKTPVGAIAVSGGTLNVLNDFNNTTANGAAVALSSAGNLNVEGTYTVSSQGSDAIGQNKTSLIANTSGMLTVGALAIDTATTNKKTDLLVDNTKLTFTGLGSETAFFTGSSIAIDGAGASLNLDSTSFVPSAGIVAGGSYTPTITLAGNGSATKINVANGSWTLADVNLTGTAAKQSQINVASGTLVIESLTKGASVVNTAVAKVLAPGTLTLQLSDVYAASASKGVLDADSSYAGTLQLLTDTVNYSDIAAIKTAVGFESGDLGLLSFINANGNSSTITGVSSGQEITVSNMAGLLIPQAVAEQNLTAATSGTLTNQFGAQSLELTSTGFSATTDVTITTAAGLTTLVGGSSNVSLVTTGNGTGSVAVKSTNIAVVDNSTLILGNPNGTAHTIGTLDGNVLLSGATSALNVSNGTFNVGDITASGATSNAVAISKGAALVAAKVSFSGTGTLSVDTGSSLYADSITGSSASGGTKTAITVGSSTDTGTATLAVGSTKLNGGSVYLDPVFVNGTTVASSSFAATFSSENGAEAIPSASTNYLIDGKYVSGQGGQLTLGSGLPQILQNALDTDLSGRWGLSGPTGITSALALAKAVSFNDTYTNAFLRVGSGLNATGNLANASLSSQFYLGENALLGIDANALRVNGVTSKAAVSAYQAVPGTGTETAVIEDGAKLFIISALGGDSIKVLDGFKTNGISLNNAFANGNNVFFDNYLLTAGAITNPSTGGTLTVNVVHNDAQTLLPGIENGVANIVNQYNAQTPPAKANDFMELALSRILHNDSADAITNSLEAGIDLARASDLMGAGLAAANMNFDAVLDRAAGRLANNGLAAGSMLGGATIGLWGMPLYANESVDAKIDTTSYKVKADTNVFGGIIGVDMNYETMRFGLAFHVGSGDTKSKHNVINTKNEFDYVGGSLYGAYVIDKFTLAGSVAYTNFSNSIKQNMMMGEQLKAKPDSDIWNFGAEAAYTYTLGSGLNIIPSLGVEWAYFNQSSYNTSLNGVGNVIHVGSASANQVRIPVGLKINKTIEMSESASITPEVRARVIPMFGDSLDTTATLTNVPSARGGIKGLQTDNVAGEVGVGISMNLNGNFSMAAGYDFQFSKNRTAHNVNAMLRYEF